MQPANLPVNTIDAWKSIKLLILSGYRMALVRLSIYRAILHEFHVFIV